MAVSVDVHSYSLYCKYTHNVSDQLAILMCCVFKVTAILQLQYKDGIAVILNAEVVSLRMANWAATCSVYLH
jgi:hypothetical protein